MGARAKRLNKYRQRDSSPDGNLSRVSLGVVTLQNLTEPQIVDRSGFRVAFAVVLTPGGASPAPTKARRIAAARQSERDGGAGTAGGAVDGFDQGDAFAAFGAVADGFAVGADGTQEIFENFLVAADVGDGGGGCAQVRVLRSFGCLLGRCGITQIHSDDAIVFEDYGAFGAGDFHAALIAGKSRGCRMQGPERSVREFEDRGGCIFGFDLVQRRRGARLNPRDVA